MTQLTADGSALVFSTYLGGSDDDWVAAITVGGAGARLCDGGHPVHRLSHAECLPANPSPEGMTPFVAQLTADGSALVYSTYLGGSEGDGGDGIAVGRRGAGLCHGEHLVHRLS